MKALKQLEMVKQVQRNLDTRDDGDPARHTWTVFLLETTPKSIINKLLPFAIAAFGEWLAFADPLKCNPFDGNGKRVKDFANCVSGSFSYNKEPISIMISKGETIRAYSCHYWCDRPESVFCVYKDGTINVQRVKFDWELENRDQILWAVGGAGMMNNFAPIEEGFTRVEWKGKVHYFQDVWRDTSHIILAADSRGFINVGYVTGQNYNEMVAWLIKIGADPDKVILLDGGHVTAINIEDKKANLYQAQYYMIQLG